MTSFPTYSEISSFVDMQDFDACPTLLQTRCHELRMSYFAADMA